MIRKIKRCPTVVVYMKNVYDLEDVLVKVEGERVGEITVERVKDGLRGIKGLERKWEYLLSL